MTGPQDAAAHMGATNGAMQDIITSANKGQFQVTPEAGDELIKIFQEIEDWTTGAQYDLDRLKQRTPLGHSPAGKTIADFNQQVAAGGEDSYEALIKQTQTLAPQVVDAIKKGIAQYQETDEGNATSFGGQT